MGSLNPFKAPKAPAAPPPPKLAPLPEPITKAAQEEKVGKSIKEEKRRLSKQAGRKSTTLTSDAGISGDDSSSIAVKRLLGGQ